MIFSIKNDLTSTHKLPNYILENSKHLEIILGLDILKTNNSIINLEEKPITIYNNAFEVDNRNNELNINDKKIFEK